MSETTTPASNDNATRVQSFVLNPGEMAECSCGFGPELFDFPYTGHVFVMLRPKKDSPFYANRSFYQWNGPLDEWQPAMVDGHGNGQRISIIGSQFSYMPDWFEIA